MLMRHSIVPVDVVPLSVLIITLLTAIPALGSTIPVTNLNYSGPLTVDNTTVSGNSAAQGAGIWNNGNASLTVTNSTISGNTATSNGGGVDNAGGFVTIINTTFSGNSAPTGGAILNDLSGTL